VIELRVPPRCLLPFTVLGQLFQRIGAYRLQQPPPCVGAGPSRCHKRLADETGYIVHDSRFDFSGLSQDRSRGPQREAADEYGKVAQQATFRFRQQLIAPVKCRPQRLLARQRGSAADRQQLEAVIQTAEHSLHPQRRGACRGELDGQRYAIEPTNDGSNRRGVRLQR
jgi:hypothetical protein